MNRVILNPTKIMPTILLDFIAIPVNPHSDNHSNPYGVYAFSPKPLSMSLSAGSMIEKACTKDPNLCTEIPNSSCQDTEMSYECVCTAGYKQMMLNGGGFSCESKASMYLLF